METKYERATETAKKIREALKFWFPGVKFSVKAKEFSMGSDVVISYTDGPALFLVEMIANGFKRDYSWDGQPICGAKYINVNRKHSEEAERATLKEMAEYYEVDLSERPAWNVYLRELGGHNLALAVDNYLYQQNIGPELPMIDKAENIFWRRPIAITFAHHKACLMKGAA